MFRIFPVSVAEAIEVIKEDGENVVLPLNDFVDLLNNQKKPRKKKESKKEVSENG